MSNYSAPQTNATLPYDPSSARFGIDTNLANGQSPQQAGILAGAIDANGVYTITYAATVTPDRTYGPKQSCLLTGNVTIAAPVNAAVGQELKLILKQNTAGSHTATWNAAFKFPAGSKTLSTTGGSIDLASGFYDGTEWLMSLSKGYV